MWFNVFEETYLNSLCKSNRLSLLPACSLEEKSPPLLPFRQGMVQCFHERDFRFNHLHWTARPSSPFELRRDFQSLTTPLTFNCDSTHAWCGRFDRHVSNYLREPLKFCVSKQESSLLFNISYFFLGETFLDTSSESKVLLVLLSVGVTFHHIHNWIAILEEWRASYPQKWRE